MPENPFNTAFCRRPKAQADLITYARSNTATVLHAPRRFGKTSLIKQVQTILDQDGYLTVYCNFFGVTALSEMAGRIANAVFNATRTDNALFQKAIHRLTAFRPVLSPAPDGTFLVSVQHAFKTGGIDVFETVMMSLANLFNEISKPVHMVFDEFQELTELDAHKHIEAIMCRYLKQASSSFVFAGSRQKLLLGLFNDPKRPFYKSACVYELKSLPQKELMGHIAGHFNAAGKTIKQDHVHRICELIKKHPYYAQQFCFFLFDAIDSSVTNDTLCATFDMLLKNERSVFESILLGLKAKQIAMLIALAKEPSKNLYSAGYMRRHHLGSTGGIQNSLDVLMKRDVIEKDLRSGLWEVVDPVFRVWLTQLGATHTTLKLED